MKKGLISRLSAMLLVLVFAFSVMLISACKKVPPIEDNSSSANAQASNSGTSNISNADQSGGPQYNDFQNRSNYSIENLVGLYSNVTLSQLANYYNPFELADGYMLGDIFNAMIKSVNDSYGGQSDLVYLCGFKLGNDGNWYSIASGKKPHSVVNKLFSFKLDGSGNGYISPSELETYKDTLLIDLLGYPELSKSFLKAYPLTNVFCDSTVSQWVQMLSGNEVEALVGVCNIFGRIRVFDILPLELKSSDVSELLVGDAIAAVSLNSVVSNPLKAHFLVRTLKFNKQIPLSLLNRTMTVNNVNYTVGTAATLLYSFNNISNETLNAFLYYGIDYHIYSVYNALEMNYGDLAPYIQSYCQSTYTEKFTQNQNIGEVLWAMISTVDMNVTFFQICHDRIAYLNTEYGNEKINETVKVSDLADVVYALLCYDPSQGDDALTNTQMQLLKDTTLLDVYKFNLKLDDTPMPELNSVIEAYLTISLYDYFVDGGSSTGSSFGFDFENITIGELFDLLS